MRPAPRTLALLLVVALAAGSVRAQDPPGRVAFELSPAEAPRIGQRIPARLVLEWTGGEVLPEGPRFPVWDAGWGPVEVLGAGPVETFEDQSGRRIWTQELTLVAFEAGDLDLPPRTIAVPTAEGTVELDTGEESLSIASVLPPPEESAELEPKPPAPLTELEPSRAFPIAAALAGLLLLALGALALRRAGRQTPAVRAAAPPRPPLEELELALGGIDPASAEAAHVAISTGLRRYLGRRLGLRALESTTTELRRGLLGSQVPEDATHALVQLLRACDQVKFARRDLDPERTAARVDQALRLGRSIESSLRPEPTAAADDPAEEAA